MFQVCLNAKKISENRSIILFWINFYKNETILLQYNIYSYHCFNDFNYYSINHLQPNYLKWTRRVCTETFKFAIRKQFD